MINKTVENIVRMPLVMVWWLLFFTFVCLLPCVLMAPLVVLAFPGYLYSDALKGIDPSKSPLKWVRWTVAPFLYVLKKYNNKVLKQEVDW